MCKNVCNTFKRKSYLEKNHYCQDCAKFIPYRFLFKEKKTHGRLRCSCCHGLVRTKPKMLSQSKNTSVMKLKFT